MHYVYFIQKADDEKGPIKIGRTTDLKRRLRTLQTASPWKLIIRSSFMYDDGEFVKKLERLIHKIAKQRFKKINGEWFLIKGRPQTLVDEAERKLRNLTG
jgi:hypothetical protein